MDKTNQLHPHHSNTTNSSLVTQIIPSTHPIPPYVTTFTPKVFLPEMLNLRQMIVLGGRKEKFFFHYAYVISTVLYRTVVYKGYSKGGFIPINYKTLINIISQKKAPEILNDLISWGILETDGYYSHNAAKSKGYKLTEKYLKMPFKTLKVTDKLMISKLTKLHHMEAKELSELPESYMLLNYFLQEIEFDYKSARKFIEKNRANYTEEERNGRISQSMLLRDKDLFFKVDSKGNRAHTNLTNLSSDLRQFVSYNGNKLCSIDIRNSQPFFFNMLTGDLGTDDYNLFKEKTQQGIFYDHLMDQFGVDIKDRKEFKQMFFGRVFFDVNRTELKKEEKLFKLIYPTVFEEIRRFKEKDYKNLAIQLQRIESKAIIERCVGRIYSEKLNSMFVNTIHDSIVCEVDNCSYVQNIIKEEFNKHYNLTPTLKIEVF